MPPERPLHRIDEPTSPLEMTGIAFEIVQGVQGEQGEDGEGIRPEVSPARLPGRSIDPGPDREVLNERSGDPVTRHVHGSLLPSIAPAGCRCRRSTGKPEAARPRASMSRISGTSAPGTASGPRSEIGSGNGLGIAGMVGAVR